MLGAVGVEGVFSLSPHPALTSTTSMAIGATWRVISESRAHADAIPEGERSRARLLAKRIARRSSRSDEHSKRRDEIDMRRDFAGDIQSSDKGKSIL
jgi:hypothetical protein